jgi:hypothetical protein
MYIYADFSCIYIGQPWRKLTIVRERSQYRNYDAASGTYFRTSKGVFIEART